MKKDKISLIFFIIQTLITIACIVFCVMYFLGDKSISKILEILVSCDLIIMGISNSILGKEKKYTIIYFVVGGIMLIAGILKILGVI